MELSSFELDANQDLIAYTQVTLPGKPPAAGPRILFGQMATAEQLDSLDAKVNALKALAARNDLAHSHLDYINLENPHQPVTHTLPSPSPSPSPSPHH
jgi:hypothetical protein